MQSKAPRAKYQQCVSTDTRQDTTVAPVTHSLTHSYSVLHTHTALLTSSLPLSLSLTLFLCPSSTEAHINTHSQLCLLSLLFSWLIHYRYFTFIFTFFQRVFLPCQSKSPLKSVFHLRSSPVSYSEQYSVPNTLECVCEYISLIQPCQLVDKLLYCPPLFKQNVLPHAPCLMGHTDSTVCAFLSLPSLFPSPPSLSQDTLATRDL